MSDAPVKIDYLTGLLSQASNIDREMYLNDQQSRNKKFETDYQESANQDGILSLNIESSYASASYAYCQVNIFIQDINDNPPIARISPVSRFQKQSRQKQNPNQIQVSEITAVNQILAYVAVYDSDAGENGTIKSIDLTLTSFKQPSVERINRRMAKIKLLQNAGYEVPILPKVENNPALPFKLNKIGNKMYTIQLAEKLNYNLGESYEIEMRIQDNGTRPQLETKTTISLTVIENNKFEPLFINKQTELIINEASYSPIETVVLNRVSNTEFQWPVVYKFVAVDLDENKNGQVTYQFLNNPYFGKYTESEKAKQLLFSTFHLDANNGELTLLRALNREEIDGDWLNITVIARDNAARNKKSSNFTVRIKVADSNNNKPFFETTSENYTIFLEPITITTKPIKLTETREEFLGLKGFKQIGSLRVKDKDSFKANSDLYNQTESDMFLFKETTCMRSFSFNLEKSYKNEDFPFVFLVDRESLPSGSEQLAEDVRCQLTIWLDLNNAVGINSISKRESIEFRLTVKDNGPGGLNDEMSSVLVKIDLKQTGNEDLIQIQSMANSTIEISDAVEIRSEASGYVAQFVLVKNSSVNIEKVTLLERDNRNMPILTDVESQDVFKIDNLRLKVEENARQGPYLIELSLNTFLNGQISRSLERVQLVLGNDLKKEFTGLLKEYNEHNQAALNGKFQSSYSDILRLFSSGKSQPVTSASLFNRQSPLNQFALLVCIVSFILFMLFTSCVCCLCKKKCQTDRKNKQKDKLKNDSKKTLNVSDSSSKLDDSQGGFNQIRIDQSSQKSTYDEKKIIFIDHKDKVNRYLEGLSSIGSNDVMINADQMRNISSSPPTSMSSLGDSTKKTTQIQQHSIKSTTSLSCISDEGCYGSSDFSTESINNKLSHYKQNLHPQQQYFSPTALQQSQSHYIHNLSRFEKIYNDTSVNQQAVTAISGSYV